MTDIKWIKISTEMFSDEKIKVIEAMPEADTVLLIWIKLLSLAGRTNAGGYIFLTEDVPYTEDTLSTVMGRPKTVVSMALTIFVKFKMIIISDNGYLLISNWERYQNVDGMERIRALTAVRTQEYRKRKAIQSCDVTVTLPVTDVTHTDIELRTKNKNKELSTIGIDVSKETSTPEPKIDKSVSKKPKKDSPNNRIRFDRTPDIKDAKFIGITQGDIDVWEEAYPAVDFTVEVKKAIAWIYGAGAKGYKSKWYSFLNGWFSRCQEHGGTKNGRI